MKKAAQEIHDLYVEEGSKLEINIDQKIRDPVQQAIDEGDQDCFEDAKEAMFHLMEPIFLKFRTSELFSQMRKEIGKAVS